MVYVRSKNNEKYDDGQQQQKKRDSTCYNIVGPIPVVWNNHTARLLNTITLITPLILFIYTPRKAANPTLQYPERKSTSCDLI